MNRRALYAVFGVIMFCVLVFLYQKTQSIDVENHQLFIARIKDFQTTHTHFNFEVVKLQYLHLSSYDTLVSDIATLRRLNRELRKIPDFVSDEGEATLVRLVNSQLDSLQDLGSLTEKLKSKNAVLRNSQTYFPEIAREVVDKLETSSEEQELQRIVSDLHNALLTYDLSLDPSLVPGIETLINSLPSEEEHTSEIIEFSEIENLKAHAIKSLEFTPLVQEITDDLIEIPLSNQAKDILRVYNTEYLNAVRTVAGYRLVLFGIVILLLASIAFFIHRLQESKGALRIANEGLETRVQERTYELKQTNEELENRALLSRLAANIGFTLAQDDSLESILQQCAEHIVKDLDGAFARIWTLNENENVLELKASAGMYTHLDGPHGRVPVGKFKIGLIAEERSPHLTNNVVGDARVGDQDWAKREAMVSFAGHPLICNGKVVGVMAMFSRKMMPDVTLQALAAVADGIASGIERKQSEEALRESESRVTAIVNTAVDGIITIDQEGIVRSFNPAAKRMFGFEPEEIIGRNVNSLMPEPYHQEHDGYLKHYRDTGEEKVIGKGREVVGKRKDGSVFPIHLAVSGMELVDRQLFVGITRDITDQVDSRQKLEKYATELERSNRDLQDFASVASHDLQEPLRKIESFGGRLRSACEGKIDESGFEYLNRIESATQRMRTLIHDLLNFSRVTTRAKPFQRIDLNDVMKDALKILETAIEESNATVHVEELPSIAADSSQMTQLFQNLVGNALKYRKPDVHPEIKVTGHLIKSMESGIPGEELCEIRIQDNGIGFEPKYADRIFGIFQRLHGRGAYEGTGVGLAICKKVVERHRGQVKAEGEDGVGATFTVTLPVNQPQSENGTDL